MGVRVKRHKVFTPRETRKFTFAQGTVKELLVLTCQLSRDALPHLMDSLYLALAVFGHIV